MKDYVQLSVRTRIKTHDWSFGKAFLNVLGGVDSRLAPESIGNFEVSKQPFVSVDASEPAWAPAYQTRVHGSLFENHQDFFWRHRSVVRMRGYVFHTQVNQSGDTVPGSISLTAAWHEDIAWSRLFRELSILAAPQIGMLHLFTQAELNAHEAALDAHEDEFDVYNAYDSFRGGSFKASLKPEIPNVGWAMFFGDEFAQEVDAPAISSAGFPVEKMANGYLIRVTESIADVCNDYAAFSSRRAVLKSLFRANLFLMRDEP